MTPHRLEKTDTMRHTQRYLASITVILACICAGCTSTSSIAGDNNTGETTLTYKGEKPEMWMDSIAHRYCHLVPETNENSLLGSINRVIKHDSIFIICDEMKQVMAFDEKGKHQFTIHNIGEGPGKYSSLWDIAIDDINNQLLLLSDNKIIRYNLDGTYAGKETALTDYIHEIVVSGDVGYMKLSTYTNNELSPYLVRTRNLANGDTTEYMETLPEYAPYCTFLGTFMNMTHDGKVYLTRKFDPNIYSLTQTSYKAEYHIDWGDSAFIPDPDKTYECSDIFHQCFMEQKIYAPFNFQKGDSIISLATNYPGFYYGSINSDELYRVMSPMDSEFNVPMGAATPVEGSDGMVVFVLHNFLMEKMLKSPTFANDKFRQLFATLDDDSNPILIFYQLK